MINTSYSSQQLLTLFGRKAQGQAQPHDAATSPDRLKAVADLAKQAKAGAAATASAVVDEVNPSEIVVPEGHVWETRAEFDAKMAKARAEMETWEAGEQAFEKENGFRRQVNAPLQNLYNEALSGQLRPNSFQSHQEAQDYASGVVAGVWGNLVTSNSDTKTLATPAWIDQMAKNRDLTTGQMTAKLEDDRKAAQMNMLIEGVILNKSLEVSGGPLYAKQDGYYHMNNVEVRYGGKLVLTVEEHGGKITLFNEDGSSRELGTMHQIAQNQPGAYGQRVAG
ncbi:hypothetical protein FHG66_20685 [Rubellimicrobium rubrum]|uniref:Uncharacterized protein n=1 Tax=Rubellimicrobium rubrum TaxID=2585369 RepID=A0A5C4MMN6_9RHOB|nr:hypothetical protein [Rubellimicrobium rubrum]TNC44249.1 hypothetical protein FHG66_20685 [Rubellimicrobium rubrum]